MKNIIEKLIENKIFQSVEIETKDIIISEEILSYCKANKCGKYNTNWTCPPAIPSIYQLKEQYNRYSTALIYNIIYPLEDSFDWDGMLGALKDSNNTANKIAKYLHTLKLDFKVLKSGSCDICDKCTYPDNPCKHPDIAYPPLEAYGINVMELAKKFNLNYYNGVNTITYFTIFFYNHE
ncbi:MAG: DUF2284 domain-containing protein [Clostridia bacterium]|jgi:predicted metal-binding protein|nr:DUF2284 domain-containing protein [Clostridia bacterium]